VPPSRSGSSAHHRVVVIGLRRLDIELAVLVLEEPVRPRDDHRAHRLGALNVAVVVDFDPLRRLGQFQELRQLAQDFCLGAGFGHAPVERLGRVAACLFDQAAPVAPLRHRNFHLVARAFAESFGQ